MKNQGLCPKCSLSSVVRVDDPSRSNFTAIGSNIFSMIQVDRYVCTSCGYIEYWVAEKGDLEKIKKRHG